MVNYGAVCRTRTCKAFQSHAAFREQCVTDYANTALAPTSGFEPEHRELPDYCHLSKMIPYQLGLCRYGGQRGIRTPGGDKSPQQLSGLPFSTRLKHLSISGQGRCLPLMVGRVGFEPTMFTARVTDLQSAAFANYAYRPIIYVKVYFIFGLALIFAVFGKQDIHLMI